MVFSARSLFLGREGEDGQIAVLVAACRRLLVSQCLAGSEPTGH